MRTPHTPCTLPAYGPVNKTSNHCFKISTNLRSASLVFCDSKEDFVVLVDFSTCNIQKWF